MQPLTYPFSPSYVSTLSPQALWLLPKKWISPSKRGFLIKKSGSPAKREFSTFHSRKKCLLCIMPYFAPLWTSLDHLCITLCTYCIYYIAISSLYFICNDFSNFYYLLSQLFLFFKGCFLFYIYILWFYILLSLRYFGSALLYMAVFFPLFFSLF